MSNQKKHPNAETLCLWAEDNQPVPAHNWESRHDACEAWQPVPRLMPDWSIDHRDPRK